MGDNELDNQQNTRLWQGKTIQTSFNPNICMDAKYCASLNKLRQQEVEQSSAVADKIDKIVGSCPSGTLSYQFLDHSIDGLGFESSAELEIKVGGRNTG